MRRERNTQTPWDPVFHFTTYFSTQPWTYFPSLSPFHFKAINLSLPNTLRVSPSSWLQLAMEGIRADPGTSLSLPLRKMQWPPQVRLGSSSPWINLKSPVSNHYRRKLVTEQTADWADNNQHRYYSEGIWKGLGVWTCKEPSRCSPVGERVINRLQICVKTMFFGVNHSVLPKYFILFWRVRFN